MAQWTRVSKEGLLPGSMLAVSIGGKHLIIYRDGQTYYATERRCTHQGADLARGYFEGEVIECPVHQGRFNVRTGEALSAPACLALKTYPVRLIEGEVCVNLESPDASPSSQGPSR